MDDKVALLLVAHADDTEFFAGGTVARLVAEGWAVTEVVTTDNSRGSFELDRDTLVARSREVEARAAAAVLGKRELCFLGYPDGFLGDTPTTVLREQYLRLIRRVRPRAVLTFDPWAPFEPHPDHRAVAFAAVEALAFSHMPLFHPEHREAGLAPHLVAERYFFAKVPAHANRVVDVTPFLDRKIEALAAHESQMKATIDDLRACLAATGRHPELLPLLDRDHYRPLLDRMIRAWARQVGAPAGYEAGEAFRYEEAGSFIDGLAEG
ncbi:MAG TPA: PIG-L deacetylase family protein [Polyangia bacterium]|jgi:LmbE family N-acetylglucosaminyl deacetylase